MLFLVAQVCGTDIVTYDNICILRSTSASVRLDFKGECLGQEGDSVEDICNLVARSGVCQHNTTNCKNLVQPIDGCCPVCGNVYTQSYTNICYVRTIYSMIQ